MNHTCGLKIHILNYASLRSLYAQSKDISTMYDYPYVHRANKPKVICTISQNIDAARFGKA